MVLMGQCDLGGGGSGFAAQEQYYRGVASAVRLNSNWETLEQYTRELPDTRKGRSALLSNSNSCTPIVKLKHLKKLSNPVR